MPGTHSAMSRHMFTLNGNVLSSGGAKNIAKGQFTIVKSNTATAAGATVVATGDFAALPASQVLEMRLGKHKVPDVRTASNSKAYASETFKLGNIVDIKKMSPKFTKRKFDELIIGYDGINDISAINLDEGQHAVLDILLKGDHVGFIANSCSYPIKFHFGREVGETNQEAIKRAVKALNAMTLTNNVSIQEVVDISVIDSTNLALTGVAYTFQTLTVVDNGDSNDLANVQAQYPTYNVTLTSRDGLKSTYTILAPNATVLADYTATTISAVDANCDGDAETTPTTVSTSWVEGNTCYATVENYKIQLPDGDCTASRAAELNAYYDGLTIVAGAPTGQASQELTLAGSSGDLMLAIGGVKYSEAFDTDLATTADNFVATHASAILLATGAVITADAGVITVAGASLGFPSIVDEKAGTTVTLGEIVYEVSTATGACQGVYSTQVLTNIVCDECDPIFLKQFESEAPADFEFSSWELVSGVADENAKMGIKIKGKAFDFIPTDISRDQIPFFETSTRVEVSGGYVMEVNQSFQDQYTDMFSVVRTSRAQDRDNLGGHLMQLEDASRAYFDGEVRHRDNMYARQVLGEESVLDFTKQYFQYAITIHDSKYSQGVGRTSDMGTTYNIWAELGKQATLEAYMSAIATKVGMPF